MRARVAWFVFAWSLVPLLVPSATVSSAIGEESDGFPDFGYAPSDYGGVLFDLSQDYPKEKPKAESLPKFFKPELGTEEFRRHYRENWREYMDAVRDYCFEGNIEVDWRVEDNEVRRWYHMPWQHWGRYGREGLRGLTKEAPVRPKQLAPTQESSGQTYAVAFYNDFAGHLIGRVWKDDDEIDLDAIKADAGFAHGSVIFKLLFVDLPTNEIPSLVDPVLWQGYITTSFASEERSVRTVALIQMDIMIKDDRSDHGWIFGTYQYNGKLRNLNRWDNLVPIGLQWGNDPDVRGSEFTNEHPIETRINPALKECVINPDKDELPATHLGWNGRLNGPVDNPRSSCMSCHQTAQHPFESDKILPFFAISPAPAEGSDVWMKWFRNDSCMTPFDENTIATDGSLQMAMSLKNYFDWKNSRGGHWSHSPPVIKCKLNPHGHGR